jgi:hypothetical protein
VRLLGHERCAWVWGCGGRCRASDVGPHQATPLFINDLGMGKEERLSEIRQVVIVQGELALESPI